MLILHTIVPTYRNDLYLQTTDSIFVDSEIQRLDFIKAVGVRKNDKTQNTCRIKYYNSHYAQIKYIICYFMNTTHKASEVRSPPQRFVELSVVSMSIVHTYTIIKYVSNNLFRN